MPQNHIAQDRTKLTDALDHNLTSHNYTFHIFQPQKIAKKSKQSFSVISIKVDHKDSKSSGQTSPRHTVHTSSSELRAHIIGRGEAEPRLDAGRQARWVGWQIQMTVGAATDCVLCHPSPRGVRLDHGQHTPGSSTTEKRPPSGVLNAPEYRIPWINASGTENPLT